MIDSGRVPVPERGAIENPTAWVADLYQQIAKALRPFARSERKAPR